MTRALDAVVVAAAVVWWLPTIAAGLVLAAPHVVALYGAPWRIRRAHRLIDRGRVDEAGRVITALRREDDAADRWRAELRLWDHQLPS